MDGIGQIKKKLSDRIMAEDFDIEAYLDAQIAASKEKK